MKEGRNKIHAAVRDEPLSWFRKAPFPGAFAFPGPLARCMLSLEGSPFHGGNRPMTVPMERVEDRILSIRGHRVILDADLIGFPEISCSRLTGAGKG